MNLKQRFFPVVHQLLRGRFAFAALVFLGFFLWCHVPPCAFMGLALATVSLGLLALSSEIEVFLGTTALAVGIVCTTKHTPLLVVGYAVYVVAPLVIINLYKWWITKKPQLMEIVSVFDCIAPLLFAVTFVMAWFWRLYLLEGGMAMPEVLAFCGPGLLALVAGAFLVVLLSVFATKFGYPMRAKERFVVSNFDYVWLVLYELHWIFFPVKGYPPNLLLAGVLPFMIRGLVLVQGWMRTRRWKEGRMALALLASIMTVVPVCLAMLYALFEPWIAVVLKHKNRKVGNGNR